MYSPKEIPPFIRYFKARLKPFGRPLFWLSPSIVILVSVCFWQYNNHPEWLESAFKQLGVASSYSTDKSDNPVANSKLSVEELAAGADIDNLQFLLTEVEKSKISSGLQNAQVSKPKNLYEQLRKQQKKQSKNNSNSLVIPQHSKQKQLVSNPLIIPSRTTLNKGYGTGSMGSGNLNSQDNNQSSLLNARNASSTVRGFDNTVGNSRGVRENKSPLQNAVEQLVPINQQSSSKVNNSQIPNNFNSLNQGRENGYSLEGNPYHNTGTTSTALPNYYNYLGKPQPLNTVPNTQVKNPNSFGQVAPQGFNQLNQQSVTTNIYNTSPPIGNRRLPPIPLTQNQLRQPNSNQLNQQSVTTNTYNTSSPIGNRRLPPIPLTQNQLRQPNFNQLNQQSVTTNN
ncbi:MAG: hypothetical protein F6K10_38830 [Moorea sp. SIO2B7]|nr:hypothetical protein [Moorena sp. SIO2B7]